MAFHIIHTNGTEEVDPPLSSLPALLDELKAADADHTSASVTLTHDTEWSMTVAPGGDVTFEHVEEDGVQCMQGVSDQRALELWKHLAEGDIEFLQKEPWQLGYPD